MMLARILHLTLAVNRVETYQRTAVAAAGCRIRLQSPSGIVMVQTAMREGASSRQDPVPGQERDAFWRGVLQSLGGSVAER